MFKLTQERVLSRDCAANVCGCVCGCCRVSQEGTPLTPQEVKQFETLVENIV